MRRVPASRKNQRLRPSNAALNGFNVSYRAIFIVFALNDQSGARNRAEIFFNVPLAKLRIEPNIVPPAKHFVGMLMIARKFLWQVTRFIDLANRDGASQAKLFDENVRRLQNETANLLGPGACVNQSDRATITMSKQNRPLNLQLTEEFRENHFRFMMH